MSVQVEKKSQWPTLVENNKWLQNMKMKQL